MDEFQKKRSNIQCLIYQARTARNHYEIEDCLDLIDEMREVLERMMQEEKIFICGPGHGKTLSGWQPIETAPRDGTDIIVGFDFATVWIVHVAWWRSEDEMYGFTEDDEGWWSYTLHSVTQEKLCGLREPTHWMPLPEPPIE